MANGPYTIRFTIPVYDSRDAIVGTRSPLAHAYAFETPALALKIADRVLARYAPSDEVSIKIVDRDGRRIFRPWSPIVDEVPF